MASTIKVDNVQNQPGTNIVSKCGTDVTLGASGDTVALAAGASQTGFGRTGTVDWQTGDIKTGDFTAATGKGYFVNTTSGTITATLPASPTAGDIVGLKDYALTFDTNSMFIGRNSEPINGTTGTTLEISTEGATIMLVYVDGVKGWIPTQDDASALIPVTPAYVVATGGTPCAGAIVCTNYKIHTFTGPGTLAVSCGGNAAGSNVVDYLVVAGGGAGGTSNGGGGGGGAGGFRLSNSTCMSAPLTSPLATPTAAPVIATPYPITVGGGGTPVTGAPAPGIKGGSGNTSTFSTIDSAGGGGGGGSDANCTGPGIDGGSGGGAGGQLLGTNTAGAGNTPPTNPAQGEPGGTSTPPGGGNTGSGGGGAGAAGSDSTPPAIAGPGGVGSYVVQTGFGGCYGTPGPVPSTRYFAGGGGANTENGPAPAQGAGGAGGGGAGAQTGSSATAGGCNTGGGGGGIDTSPYGQTSGAGGSGIVIIRYKFQ